MLRQSEVRNIDADSFTDLAISAAIESITPAICLAAHHSVVHCAVENHAGTSFSDTVRNGPSYSPSVEFNATAFEPHCTSTGSLPAEQNNSGVTDDVCNAAMKSLVECFFKYGRENAATDADCNGSHFRDKIYPNFSTIQACSRKSVSQFDLNFEHGLNSSNSKPSESGNCYSPQRMLHPNERTACSTTCCSPQPELHPDERTACSTTCCSSQPEHHQNERTACSTTVINLRQPLSPSGFTIHKKFKHSSSRLPANHFEHHAHYDGTVDVDSSASHMQIKCQIGNDGTNTMGNKSEALKVSHEPDRAIYLLKRRIENRSSFQSNPCSMSSKTASGNNSMIISEFELNCERKCSDYNCVKNIHFKKSLDITIDPNVNLSNHDPKNSNKHLYGSHENQFHRNKVINVQNRKENCKYDHVRFVKNELGDHRQFDDTKCISNNTKATIESLAVYGQCIAGHVLDGQSVAGHVLDDGQSIAGHVLDGQSVAGHVFDGQSVAGHVLDGQSVAGHVLDDSQSVAGHVFDDGQSIAGHVLDGQSVAGHVLDDGRSIAGHVLDGQSVVGHVLDDGRSVAGHVLDDGQSVTGHGLDGGQSLAGRVLDGQSVAGHVLDDGQSLAGHVLDGQSVAEHVLDADAPCSFESFADVSNSMGTQIPIRREHVSDLPFSQFRDRMLYDSHELYSKNSQNIHSVCTSTDLQSGNKFSVCDGEEQQSLHGERSELACQHNSCGFTDDTTHAAISNGESFAQDEPSGKLDRIMKNSPFLKADKSVTMNELINDNILNHNSKEKHWDKYSLHKIIKTLDKNVSPVKVEVVPMKVVTEPSNEECDDKVVNMSFEARNYSKEYFNNSWLQTEELLTTPEKVLCNTGSVQLSLSPEIEGPKKSCGTLEIIDQKHDNNDENTSLVENTVKSNADFAYLHQNSHQKVKLKTFRTRRTWPTSALITQDKPGTSDPVNKPKRESFQTGTTPDIGNHCLDPETIHFDTSVNSDTAIFKSSISKHTLRYKLFTNERLSTNDTSNEMCGGPHSKNAAIGSFSIENRFSTGENPDDDAPICATRRPQTDDDSFVEDGETCFFGLKDLVSKFGSSSITIRQPKSIVTKDDSPRNTISPNPSNENVVGHDTTESIKETSVKHYCIASKFPFITQKPEDAMPNDNVVTQERKKTQICQNLTSVGKKTKKYRREEPSEGEVSAGKILLTIKIKCHSSVLWINNVSLNTII